ncbi:uncharacterized protein TM35_000312090 [Trypanosoma theileri]|uniref:RING-type domain-containing protein n=1 Tax=Trypanosoma theileri TaxID=67003 RepID=A0A1X0NNF1_9TRYP|nr:uncharacterized protein TM35_000312090 [Trypanosoma theileri]ORC86023.1 hypothetical protein TM35_000312090 [Trypanosoma theileri]
MTEQYDTPSQLPPSLSVASLGDSRPAGLNSVSPMLFVATTTTTMGSVGEGTQTVQRTALLPSLLTSPLSPMSPIVAGTSGGYRCVHNINGLHPNHHNSSNSNNSNNNNNTQGMISETVMPTVLLENLMKVSGSSFTAMNPSLNPSNNSGSPAGIQGKNILHVDSSSSDEFKYQVQLSTPPSFVLTTSFPVTPATAAAVLSPTQGTHIRGVAAKEVGCVVLGADQEMNCAICFSFQDDDDEDNVNCDDSSSSCCCCDDDGDVNTVRCTLSLSSKGGNQPQKNSETTSLHTSSSVCAGTTTTTNNNTNTTTNTTNTAGGVRLTCGHSFHADCLQRWLLRSNICPMCRREVASSSAK